MNWNITAFVDDGFNVSENTSPLEDANTHERRNIFEGEQIQKVNKF